MKEDLFFATSVFKYYAGEGVYLFKVIQPLFGTYDEDEKVFTNFNGKQYYEILDKRITKGEERIGFYHLEKLVSLEEKFHTQELSSLVSLYFEQYRRDGFLYDSICLSRFDYEILREIVFQK